MGQRTQMLLKVHILGDTPSQHQTVYLAYHYQWGLGRVMPMAFLNLATHLSMGLDYAKGNFEKAVEQFEKISDPYSDKTYGAINMTADLPEDEQSKETEFQNPSKAGYDNNNGWLCAELFVTTQFQRFYLEKGEVKFYRGIEEANRRFPLGSPMSIESWQTAFSSFCSKKWLIGYRNLLSSYSIDFPYTQKKAGTK